MKYLRPLLAPLFLSACVTNSSNFVKNSAITNQLVQDVSNRVTQLYPAANTTIIVDQKNKDVFGNGLSQNLRERGFAIIENQETATEYSKENNTVNLKYIVDYVEKNTVMVSLRCNEKVTSKIYPIGPENKVFFNSPWTVKGN